MYFPKLSEPPQKRVTVDRFLGLDRRRRASEGALAAMENLTGAHYPALAVRSRRSAVGTAVKPGGLTAKDALIWVDGTALYVGGIKTGLVLTEGLKQLVSMGAYLVIWPDKKYINTKDLTDFGSLERSYESTGTVTLRLCRADGTDFGDWQAGGSAPEGAQSGALWVDTAAQTPVLRRFDGESWSAVDGVCVEIRAAGIGEGFQAGDGVEIDGCADERMNGSFLLERAESGAIVVPGILTQTVSQTETLTVSRSVPEMDYVIECGNRLWGCKYGLVDGETVNEIYASKLGDFKNWNCFAGLSTDSYAAARGSDGPFTGAADYLGSPIFFKEDCLERVYPSASGAHQIVTTRCSGVRRGDWRSVQVVDGKLYFSTGDSAAYFDLSAGTFTALEDLPQRLEALFPGAERAENTAGGGVFPAEPMGATEEVAIFAFLYEGRNVWVALRDDQVLGVLEQSLENNTITCYDSAFQQTSQVELPFSLYNLQPQASVSPFPL